MSEGQAKPKLGELLESIVSGMEEFKTEIALVKEMVGSKEPEAKDTEEKDPEEKDTEEKDTEEKDVDDSIEMTDDEIKELDKYFNEY